jgi:putative endonuclease
MTDRRRRIGAQGERAVACWYEARGYGVLDRNWRVAGGELDLVLFHAATGEVVFCEVKTRTSGSFGSGFDAVTPGKLRRVRRLAGRWLAEARPPGLAVRGLRVDVAAIGPGAGGTAAVEVLEAVG